MMLGRGLRENNNRTITPYRRPEYKSEATFSITIMASSSLSASSPSANSIDEVTLKSRIEKQLCDECTELEPFEQCTFLVNCQFSCFSDLVFVERWKSYGQSVAAVVPN